MCNKIKVEGALKSYALIMSEVEDNVSANHVIGSANETLTEGALDSCMGVELQVTSPLSPFLENGGPSMLLTILVLFPMDADHDSPILCSAKFSSQKGMF